jgi:hypothetical protein
VIGSISDDHQVFSYTVSERLRGQSAWNVLATGRGAVDNAVLGKIDTTLMLNG